MVTLIVFASVEGHTKKISEFVAKCLDRIGLEISVIDTDRTNARFDFNNIKKVILAAPVHRLRHPPSFEKFIKVNHERLSERPTLLLSVSLCAGFPEGVAEARTYVDELTDRTKFAPTMDLLVGGALQFGKYREDEAWIVRFISRGLSQYGSADVDSELTNWGNIEEAVSYFIEHIAIP